LNTDTVATFAGNTTALLNQINFPVSLCSGRQAQHVDFDSSVNDKNIWIRVRAAEFILGLARTGVLSPPDPPLGAWSQRTLPVVSFRRADRKT